MALLAGALFLLAQLEPPPTGIAVMSDQNAPPLATLPVRNRQPVLAAFANEQAAAIAHMGTTARVR